MRHLENLQRKGGFKGFNQHAVSLIIAGDRSAETALTRSSKSQVPSSKEAPNLKLQTLS